MRENDTEHGEEQVPLQLRYRHKAAWPDLKSEFGVADTGAAVILALVAEARMSGRWVSYSRDRQHYCPPKRYRERLYTCRGVVSAVDYLDAAGLIYHDRAEPGRLGWRSAMLPTAELIQRAEDVLADHPRLSVTQPKEPVILRDADGNPADYRETRNTGRMRRDLDRLNEITTSPEVSCAAPLVRIFNSTFARGGRFYAIGGAWQSMPAEQRKEIQIGGEPVAEVDYKSLHPAILYARVGAEMPADCYALPGWPDHLRPLIKVAVLITLNAASKPSARAAIAQSPQIEAVAGCGTQQAYRTADTLIDDLKAAHAPIARYFHADAGAGLMRQDSDLARDVMLTMAHRHGEVALPVHDSFLVRQSAAQQLEEVMLRVAYEHGLEGVQAERKS